MMQPIWVYLLDYLLDNLKLLSDQKVSLRVAGIIFLQARIL